MRKRFLKLANLLTGVLVASCVFAGAESIDYPYPIEIFEFTSQYQTLEMAYMDVPPARDEQLTPADLEEPPEPVAPVEPTDPVESPEPVDQVAPLAPPEILEPAPDAPVALLLHGKNFCAAYWQQTIEFLADKGFRVIAPEQVGFCRSSLPERYQFSFHQLATNTAALLDELEIETVTVIGHSMGGMLATRFALMYPERSDQLVMVNPIGLEDWLAEGVPYPTIDATFEAERNRDLESIRAYQQSNYYDGDWNEEYDYWARMLAATYEGPDGERVAWNHALTADMVLTQPVLYEFGNLTVPTTLIIGLRDTTAIGQDRVEPGLAAWLGNYPRLARVTRERIPGADLISFDDIGHMPQFEATDRYLDALEEVLHRH
ncbi:MAG: alpha/beta fold hydrolase [Wenzhouxiangella sp.]